MQLNMLKLTLKLIKNDAGFSASFCVFLKKRCINNTQVKKGVKIIDKF